MYLFCSGRNGKVKAPACIFFKCGCKAADPVAATGAQSDCAKIAVLERIVSHKLAVASAGPVSWLRKKAWLAAKVIEEPENQADRDADDQARDEREIKCAVWAAVDDVAR